jgi:endonuclease/exonuclease/phosphatase (EEP) superfamily protein YafD
VYLIAIAGLCMTLWSVSDVWWPATVLMYMPRWVFALPLAVLVPAALLTRARSLGPLLLAAILLIGPFTGLCLPWRQWTAAEATGPRVRVLTCNVHYHQLNAASLRALIDDTAPDIVALQYWTGRFEEPLFEPGNWHLHREGQFCLATRYPIKDVQPLGDPLIAVRAELEVPQIGRLFFVNLHLETPRDGLLAVLHQGGSGVAKLQENMALRRVQSAQAYGWLREVNGPLLIAGDFNTTVESTIYQEYWSSYTNAFSVAGLGWGQTQFTPRRTATRIDHILLGPGWRCVHCWVGPFVGSEHRPLLADLRWEGDK